jgi:hypothetical protein
MPRPMPAAFGRRKTTKLVQAGTVMEDVGDVARPAATSRQFHADTAPIGGELPHLGLVMLDRHRVARFHRSSLPPDNSPPDRAPTDDVRHGTSGAFGTAEHFKACAYALPLNERPSSRMPLFRQHHQRIGDVGNKEPGLLRRRPGLCDLGLAGGCCSMVSNLHEGMQESQPKAR